MFFISDTHFGHENIIKFKRDDGRLMRPGFGSIEEHDEFIVDQWNSIVRPSDKVYHLGDVCMYPGSRAINALMSKLNGHQRLVLGNHDDKRLKDLMHYYEKVGLWRVFKEHGFVCSHIPLREDQFRHNTVLNVHGHIHHNLIDSREYMNVCVEHTDYKPVHLDQILARVKQLR